MEVPVSLLLSLLLLTAPTPPQLQEQRAVVVKGLDQFDKDVDELGTFIDTRFSVDSGVPRTGLAVRSEDADADGLHPIIVETVIKDSPADIAGVRPGDRVLRVGQRRIEHETAQAFRLITDGTSGPLQLVLARGGTMITVTVVRCPLACVQRSSARINQAAWDKRLTELRRISAMIRSFLDNEAADSREKRYPAAKEQLVKLFGLYGDFTKMLTTELSDALAKECTFLTK
jgi:C-terminal processing protease CtpA/Prc